MDIDINNQDSISNDQPSYNLIDRFPDIYENIFSYLDFKSLLDSCLVCKSWNEHIGQSSKLVQKIQINIGETSETENKKALEVIKGWKRKICHIKAVALGDLGYGFKTGLNENVISYLNQNPSILKHLVTFEILALKLNQVKNIMFASNLLRNLTFKICNPLTNDDWTEFVDIKTFQLEKLSITLFHQCHISQILETQMQLKELHVEILSDLLSPKILEVVSKMEKLKKLTLKTAVFEDLQLYDNILVCNMPSLESFNIGFSPWTFYRPIINAAHNLISLRIRYLDQEFIEFAGLKLNKLKELHVYSLEGIDDIANPDLFPALEELQIDCSINAVQREFILQVITNEPMNNFLRCLYQEIIKKRHNGWRISCRWLNVNLITV